MRGKDDVHVLDPLVLNGIGGELSGEPCEALTSPGCADNGVFDSDPYLPHNVNSRLDSECHPGLELQLVPLHNIGAFVHLETYTVAQAMDKVLPTAPVINYLPGDRV